jgi:hypothetical protein
VSAVDVVGVVVAALLVLYATAALLFGERF